MASPPRLGSSGVKGAAGASRSEGTLDSRGDRAPLFAVKSQLQEPEGWRLSKAVRVCSPIILDSPAECVTKARHLGLQKGSGETVEPLAMSGRGVGRGTVRHVLEFG